MNKQLLKSESFQIFLKNENWFSPSMDIDSILGIVYKATNIINGKVYIGISKVSMEYRKKSHEGLPTYHFQKSIKKYGSENFSWEVIDYFSSKEEAVEKEKFWIWLNNSQDGNLGYNITPGGQWGDTISHHPDKDKIILKTIQSHIKNDSYKKGKDSSRYGKNDHCFGVIAYAKKRKGKTNKEFYGEEKAVQIEEKRKIAREKRKKLGIKTKRFSNFHASKELILFIHSYAYYDQTIKNFKQLFSIFKNKNRSINFLYNKSKEYFYDDHRKLNRLFKSRLSSGKLNGRYGKKVSIETRIKISKKTTGRKAHNKTFKTFQEINNLIDVYFNSKSVEETAKYFKISDTSIRKYLHKLNIKFFKKSARLKRAAWFSSNDKEDFYVK